MLLYELHSSPTTFSMYELWLIGTAQNVRSLVCGLAWRPEEGRPRGGKSEAFYINVVYVTHSGAFAENTVKPTMGAAKPAPAGDAAMQKRTKKRKSEAAPVQKEAEPSAEPTGWEELEAWEPRQAQQGAPAPGLWACRRPALTRPPGSLPDHAVTTHVQSPSPRRASRSPAM